MLKLPGLGEMDGRAVLRVFLYTCATDMRRGFDTLGALVVEEMGKDPFSGDVYVFVGRPQGRGQSRCCPGWPVRQAPDLPGRWRLYFLMR
jgi:transposase